MDLAVLLQEVNFLESQVIGGDYLSLETLEADTAKAQRFYERLQDQLEDEVAPQWETSFQVLIEGTVRLCDLVNVLVATVQQPASQDRELKSKITSLQARVESLERCEQQLIVGQVAFEIDQKALNKVLQGIGDPYSLAVHNIAHLEKAIAGVHNFEDVFASEDERKEVGRRWDQLKTTIEWTNRHYRHVKALKKVRLTSAHPEIDIALLHSVCGC